MMFHKLTATIYAEAVEYESHSHETFHYPLLKNAFLIFTLPLVGKLRYKSEFKSINFASIGCDTAHHSLFKPVGIKKEQRSFLKPLLTNKDLDAINLVIPFIKISQI